MHLPDGKVHEWRITAKEWAELNRLRFIERRRERRARVAELRTSAYARLGTDHPALVGREVTWGLANAWLNNLASSEKFAAWCMERGNAAEAARSQTDAVQTLTQAKALALAYVLISERTKAMLRRVSAAYLARLLNRFAFVRQEVPQCIAPVKKVHGISTHIAAQAPPIGVDSHNTFTVTTSRPLLYERR